jgi:hypothetical protein
MKNNKYDTISEIKLIISQCLFSMLLKLIKVTRGEIWVHNTSLTLPLFFKVPVPWQKMEWSCSCVLGVGRVIHGLKDNYRQRRPWGIRSWHESLCQSLIPHALICLWVSLRPWITLPTPNTSWSYLSIIILKGAHQ